MTTPDDDLAGWTFRFTAGGTRLDEAVEAYRALGFEVRIAPSSGRASGAGGPGCDAGCDAGGDAAVMAIFTRRCEDDADEAGADPPGDEGDER